MRLTAAWGAMQVRYCRISTLIMAFASEAFLCPALSNSVFKLHPNSLSLVEILTVSSLPLSDCAGERRSIQSLLSQLQGFSEEPVTPNLPKITHLSSCQISAKWFLLQVPTRQKTVNGLTRHPSVFHVLMAHSQLLTTPCLSASSVNSVVQVSCSIFLGMLDWGLIIPVMVMVVSAEGEVGIVTFFFLFFPQSSVR